MWTGILEDLEDSRGASSIMSLDFAKAFNRLDHSHILASYARLGASTQVVALFAAFLHGRVMRVKVGDVLSVPRPVNGGAPQGSCAGVQMYAVGIDDMDTGLPQPNALVEPRALPPDLLSTDDEAAGRPRVPRPFSSSSSGGPGSIGGSSPSVDSDPDRSPRALPPLSSSPSDGPGSTGGASLSDPHRIPSFPMRGDTSSGSFSSTTPSQVPSVNPDVLDRSTAESTVSDRLVNTNLRFAIDRSDSLISLHLPNVSEFYDHSLRWIMIEKPDLSMLLSHSLFLTRWRRRRVARA